VKRRMMICKKKVLHKKASKMRWIHRETCKKTKTDRMDRMKWRKESKKTSEGDCYMSRTFQGVES